MEYGGEGDVERRAAFEGVSVASEKASGFCEVVVRVISGENQLRQVQNRQRTFVFNHLYSSAKQNGTNY